MLRKILSLGISFAVVFAAISVQSVYSKDVLTAEDVEKVTGIQGLKLVPKNPQIGAGGDLNFAQPDGTILLIVMMQKASMYDTWKSQEGYFHADVNDIGDEAFEGPGFGEYRYILVFQKGKNAYSLSSFFNMQAGGEPYLSQDQLRELAKIIVSRL
ncbi:MAG: hypothetical protein OEZ52_10225 [Candidatus Aminicenantes bacterium]|nr:hypothetical protein [Candidatus Aminicenantes bacterium]MDH5743912.1 hypothetical protein [Candidatus Aminicenantes bacterium]